MGSHPRGGLGICFFGRKTYRKLYVHLLYVFSQRFLHTPRVTFYIQRTSDHVLSGRLQTLKLMENYETVTPEND